MRKEELEVRGTNATISIIGVSLSTLGLLPQVEKGQGMLEPYHQVLLSSEPTLVQSEAMYDGGKPHLLGAKSLEDDTYADTVPRTGGPSPSSSQFSHHNDTGQLKTLFVWATYQTKIFKINKDTFEIKKYFPVIIFLN